ncbi:hypothetical protein C4B63_247g19 [Trypanosoma cruzi]|uniref:Uncharacterized protein n=1 Tax=Trypanosoma cruzi TaxID=5693 RepID=A0A2V2UIV4_TRYCR|nr:hypothetical protein C4B63_247g19 [Trypanosoma cruzi]
MEAKAVSTPTKPRRRPRSSPRQCRRCNTAQLNRPQPLRDAGFAVAEASFDVDVALDVPDASTLFRKLCATAAPNLTYERKNMVAFSYGVRSSPKRQLMYGSAAGEGYAA